MGNCLIGFPNNIDTSTVSGGVWMVTLPQSNLKQTTLGRVARTVDDSLASAIINIDQGKATPVRIVALVNHNLSTAARRRLRATSEAAAKNLLYWSRDFTNPMWVLISTSVIPNVAIGPDGLMSMDKLVEGTGAATVHAIIQNRSGTNETLTYSALLSAAARHYVLLGMSNGVSAQAGVIVDLTLGTIVAIDAANADYTNISAKVVSMGGGIYRCSITATKGSVNSVNTPALYILDNTGAPNYAGDGVSGINIFQMQLEAGSVATSIMPDGFGTQAVRPAGYMDSWQSYSYDSGWVDVWPVVFPFPVLEWEDDRWWSGKYGADELAGSYHTMTAILPAAVTQRYWRLEFDDTGNPDGYIQAGRVFIGPAWQPTINPSYGMSTAWETKTDVQPALGGAEYYGRRTPYRTTRFSLDWMSEDEGMSQAFDIDRRAGIDKEVFWVHDPDDTVHANRRQYLGRFRALSPIEYPYHNITKKAFEIKESL